MVEAQLRRPVHDPQLNRFCDTAERPLKKHCSRPTESIHITDSRLTNRVQESPLAIIPTMDHHPTVLPHLTVTLTGASQMPAWSGPVSSQHGAFRASGERRQPYWIVWIGVDRKALLQVQRTAPAWSPKRVGRSLYRPGRTARMIHTLPAVQPL